MQALRIQPPAAMRVCARNRGLACTEDPTFGWPAGMSAGVGHVGAQDITSGCHAGAMASCAGTEASRQAS